MKKETAQKAAKWWVDQLRANAKLDNGDNSINGAFTSVLGGILQEKEKAGQSTELVYKFEQALADLILKKEPYCFGVDYHPDRILEDAAQSAGLSLGMTTLPWKTNMWIRDDKIKVACGYGAASEEL